MANNPEGRLQVGRWAAEVVYLLLVWKVAEGPLMWLKSRIRGGLGGLMKDSLTAPFAIFKTLDLWTMFTTGNIPAIIADPLHFVIATAMMKAFCFFVPPQDKSQVSPFTIPCFTLKSALATAVLVVAWGIVAPKSPLTGYVPHLVNGTHLEI